MTAKDGAISQLTSGIGTLKTV